MPLEAALIALAALAGNTVVTAAVTDAWDAARKGFARLLGRSDPDKTKLAEQRLAEMHDQLTQATGAELEWTRATCWKRTRASRLTCALWWRRSRRSCLLGWCPPLITRWRLGAM
jgi:hypothetical protein